MSVKTQYPLFADNKFNIKNKEKLSLSRYTARYILKKNKNLQTANTRQSQRKDYRIKIKKGLRWDPTFVNLKSNTMKNTLQIYDYFSKKNTDTQILRC